MDEAAAAGDGAAGLDRFRAGLARDGFDGPSEVTIEPDRINPEHCHPFDVRVLVLAGAITITIGGESTRYGEGEVFAVPRDCPHAERLGSAGLRGLVGRRGPAAGAA